SVSTSAELILWCCGDSVKEFKYEQGASSLVVNFEVHILSNRSLCSQDCPAHVVVHGRVDRGANFEIALDIAGPSEGLRIRAGREFEQFRTAPRAVRKRRNSVTAPQSTERASHGDPQTRRVCVAAQSIPLQARLDFLLKHLSCLFRVPTKLLRQ